MPQLCLQKSEDLLLPPALLEATGLNVSLCCLLQRSDVRVGPLLSPPSCSSSSACGQAKEFSVQTQPGLQRAPFVCSNFNVSCLSKHLAVHPGSVLLPVAWQTLVSRHRRGWWSHHAVSPLRPPQTERGCWTGAPRGSRGAAVELVASLCFSTCH